MVAKLSACRVGARPRRPRRVRSSTAATLDGTHTHLETRRDNAHGGASRPAQRGTEGHDDDGHDGRSGTRGSARSADVPTPARHVRARRRRAPVRRRRQGRTSICSPALASRRWATRTRGSRDGARRSGADAAAHVEPVLPPAAGRSWQRGSRRCPGSTARSSATAARKRWRRASSSPGATGIRRARPTHRVRRAPRRRSTAGRWASLSVTWDEHYRAPFEPLLPGVTFVDATTPPRSSPPSTTTTAAIIVEPIQGEGGVRRSRAAFAAAISEACDAPARSSLPTKSRRVAAGPAIRSTHAASGSSRTWWRSARRSAAGVPVGAALISERGRRHDHARRPRHHLRRQPARVPGGALRPRRDESGAAQSTSAALGATFDAAARHRGSVTRLSRVAARALIWGIELDRRRGRRRAGRAGARPHREPDGRERHPPAAALHHHRTETWTTGAAWLGASPRRLSREPGGRHGRSRALVLELATSARRPEAHARPDSRPTWRPGICCPRTARGDHASHARFVVADRSGKVVGCAELRAAQRAVAEVRSLVGRTTRARPGIAAASSSTSFGARARAAGFESSAPSPMRRAISSARLLDRAAPVGAGEGAHRLRRRARSSAAAASTRWCCRSSPVRRHAGDRLSPATRWRIAAREARCMTKRSRAASRRRPAS